MAIVSGLGDTREKKTIDNKSCKTNYAKQREIEKTHLKKRYL